MKGSRWMIKGVLMKVRHEVWDLLKAARPIEHEWLDRAKQEETDNSYWSVARPGERGSSTRASSRSFRASVSVLFRFFVGFKPFCPRLF